MIEYSTANVKDRPKLHKAKFEVYKDFNLWGLSYESKEDAIEELKNEVLKYLLEGQTTDKRYNEFMRMYGRYTQ